MNQAPTIDQADREGIPFLDVESILSIHRDPHGYVGFVRKPETPRIGKDGKPYQFENLFSIRADDLRSMFPAFAHWLTHDSYFTVNAYYCPAPYLNKTTGFPDVRRKEKYLKWLTACYTDLDCGRPESEDLTERLTWRQAQYKAGLLIDSGVIPPASIMARSGRGVYLFWLLRDAKDPDKLPAAYPEKIVLYKTINRALNERLRTHQLPADPAAIDAARVLRVPGSIHRKALRRVTYVIEADEHGRGFVYTLPELADFLKLPAPDGDLPPSARALAKPAQYRKVKNPGSAPLRSHGPKKLNSLRAQDLLTIETWRGGFLKRGMKYPDGHISPGRRFTLVLYANFLRGSGATSADALDALRQMAANMEPSYPSDSPQDDPPIEWLVKAKYSTKKRRRWRNEKLLDLLGITVDVARELELKTIRHRELAAEADRARPRQADLIKKRRAFAREYLERGGRPTARKLAKAYKEAGFSGANHETANQDLNALGHVVRPSRGGRPHKAAK